MSTVQVQMPTLTVLDCETVYTCKRTSDIASQGHQTRTFPSHAPWPRTAQSSNCWHQMHEASNSSMQVPLDLTCPQMWCSQMVSVWLTECPVRVRTNYRCNHLLVHIPSPKHSSADLSTQWRAPPPLGVVQVCVFRCSSATRVCAVRVRRRTEQAHLTDLSSRDSLRDQRR